MGKNIILPGDDEKKSRRYPVIEHITMARITWRFEIFGYFIICAIVIAALLGFFSNGIVSEREIASDNNLLTVKYERFARNGTQTQWKVQIKSMDNHPVTLRVSAALTDYYLLENIQPQSVVITHYDNEVIFTIPNNEEQQWHTFYFVLRPQKWGSFHTSLTVWGSHPVVIKQWIYP